MNTFERFLKINGLLPDDRKQLVFIEEELAKRTDSRLLEKQLAKYDVNPDDILF